MGAKKIPSAKKILQIGWTNGLFQSNLDEFGKANCACLEIEQRWTLRRSKLSRLVIGSFLLKSEKKKRLSKVKFGMSLL